ncbi:hypothetical protein ACFSKL_09690, partial [Belliella marina]
MNNQVEIGFWELEMGSGMVTVSRPLADMAGLGHGGVLHVGELFGRVLHAREGFRILRKARKAVACNRSFSETVVISPPGGLEPVRLVVVGKPVAGGGHAVKLSGMALRYNGSRAESVAENPVEGPCGGLGKPLLDKDVGSLCSLTIEQKIVLTEVRYYLSHRIMNHVANLMGLYDIYRDLDTEGERREFVDYMGISIGKLDDEIRMVYDRIESV